MLNNQKKQLYTSPVEKRPNASLPDKIQVMLNEAHPNFFKKHHKNYEKAKQSIDELREYGILRDTIPVKKQTLAEKLYMVKNYDSCVEVYNKWIEQNPSMGSVINQQELLEVSNSEQLFWAPQEQDVTIKSLK